jgi:hypothetical protein
VRDLIQLTEGETPELTAGHGARLFLAVSLAAVACLLTIRSAAPLLIDSQIPSLPGMNQWFGQLGWSVALIVMLTAVTFLVRGVVQRRLQWAIGLSLLIHLLLCLFASGLKFEGQDNQKADAAGSPQRDLEEFSLPDYAASETNAETAWEQPSETATPETPLEMQRAEIRAPEVEEKPETETTTEVAPEKAEVPELVRDQPEPAEFVDPAKRKPIEISLSEPQELSSPEVAASESPDLLMEAVADQSRPESQLPDAERALEQSQPSSLTFPEVSLAKVENRRPDQNLQMPEETQTSSASERRTVREAAVAMNEEVLSVESSDVEAPLLEEQASDSVRQDAALPERSSIESPSKESMLRQMTEVASASLPGATARAMTSSMQPGPVGSVNLERANVSRSGAASAAASDVSVPSTDSSAARSRVPAESQAASARQRQSASQLPTTGQAGGVTQASTSSASSRASENALTGAGRSTGFRNGRSTAAPQISDGSGNAAGATGSAQRAALSALASNTVAGSEAEGGGSSVAAAEDRDGSGQAMVSAPSLAMNGRSKQSLPGNGGSGATGNPASGGDSGRSNNAAGQSGSLRSGRQSVAEETATSGAPVAANVGGLLRRREGSGLPNIDGGSSTGNQSTGRRMSGLKAAGSASLGTLSAEDISTEQSGGLVQSGPQPGRSSAQALAGPRSTGMARRTTELPGSSGRSGSDAAGSMRTAGGDGEGPAVRAVSITSRNNGVGNAPSLASAEAVTGLVRRSAASATRTAQIAVPESLSLRNADSRREAARTLGGSVESEQAVERGLEWLVRHQYPDGRWSIHEIGGEGAAPGDNGRFQSDTAATGLALLAFLGAGYTHQSDKYQEVVGRGLKWLTDRQKPDGDLFSDESEFVWFYSHGIASIAICEAYALTKDDTLKGPAQRSLDFIVRSQQPQFGGWRYRPRFESDTSVSGWQLMALKSGEMSGLNVSASAYEGVSRWLKSVEKDKGQYSYHPSKPASPAMTAEALLMRQYLGANRSDEVLIAGASFLRTRTPDFGARDAYYWYYATQVMFHMQGDYWKEWNGILRDQLVTTQSVTGPSRGSWDPASPTVEKWAVAGGRHYLTCLNLLMLEVYYRHLPLYVELEK